MQRNKAFSMPHSDRTLQSVNLPADWAPASWRARPAQQLPRYPDEAALRSTLDELRALPPLVTSWEIIALKQHLAEAQEGKRFLLQGGDCAENLRNAAPM
jgi:3-deoxy-7-phosphoheptulonate synthase